MSAETERPGIAFQNFVTSLECAISQREGVTVESSKRLIDKDTGRLREHDVVITWKSGHHTVITAIECKDTGRKVGVKEIEAFSRKCERTGVHHRVMVSANGFTNTARTKADAFDIQCMTLSEASAFDWMGFEFFIHFQREFGHLNATVFFKDNIGPDVPFKLFDGANVEMTAKELVGVVQQALPKGENLEALVGVTHPVRVHVNTIGWRAEDQIGASFPVDYVEIETSFTITRSALPVRLHSYEGSGANYAIASTDVDLGEHAGKIVFIADDDENVRVVWTQTK